MTERFISPLLTDFYQISMVYTYWKANRHLDTATFELYFRKCPFKGAYTIFAGLSEVLHFLKNFKLSPEDVNYIKTLLPESTEPEFFQYLLHLDTKNLKVEALSEGSVCFPKVPLLILTGLLPIVQLIETPLLNIINFSSLIATNAARFRHAAGDETTLLEFGLRRAQGPNGGLTASRYSVIGGFDGSSNVLAGKYFGIHVSGTHSHSYVNSFTTLEPLDQKTVSLQVGDQMINIFEQAKLARQEIQKILKSTTIPKESELIAFSTYAATFPNACLCLIDTYDTLGSGLINFLSVAAVLAAHNFKPKGVRLDSGDLAYISKKVRASFTALENLNPEKYPNFSKILITASNSINEETLYSLNEQGHEIDAFGIGTHLVTCQAQPALGCVYKMVQMNETPRMKLTEGHACTKA